MRQVSKDAYDRCSSCKSTTQRSYSQNISFSKIISEFNKTLQVNFLFVTEVSDFTILPTIGSHSRYSKKFAISSKEMKQVSKPLKLKWIKDHGCLRGISENPEFFNKKMREAMEYFQITIEQRMARSHTKPGVVEGTDE